MIYIIRCESSLGASISTLGITLKKGDAFECPERVYHKNREMKSLASTGAISVRPKQAVVAKPKSKGLGAITKLKAPPQVQQPTQVVHNTEVINKTEVVQQNVDLDDLTEKLMARLSGLLSPELLAQAIASQLPAQQVVVQQSESANSTNQQGYNPQSSEELTFIPSKIISDTTKVSSSMASESSGEDNDLSDALSALRAMRKANKDG